MKVRKYFTATTRLEKAESGKLKFTGEMKMMQKQTKYRLCETLCILVLTFSLSGCTKNMADTISTTEINGQDMEVEFSESNENKVWTEEEIKSKFSDRFNQDKHLEIVDYEVVSDNAYERIGAVLLKDRDTGAAEVAFIDNEGDFQKLGISAELAPEPEFTYIGNGVVSFKLLTVEGTLYTCEVSFTKENDEIKFVVNEIFD